VIAIKSELVIGIAGIRTQPTPKRFQTFQAAKNYYDRLVASAARTIQSTSAPGKVTRSQNSD
jgi:hypothetical protein